MLLIGCEEKIQKVEFNIMKYPLMRNNFDKDDLEEVINLLRQDDPRLTNGTNVQDFESAWSKWLGVRFSVFVNSGSSANLLSLVLLKHRFPEGGEVMYPVCWVSEYLLFYTLVSRPCLQTLIAGHLGWIPPKYWSR